METEIKHASRDCDDSSDEDSATKNKQRIRGKKRKRVLSDSSSAGEDILPDNMLMLENKVHTSAVKNNLDDNSVRKILKKVVTNDRVLALIKLKGEKESTKNGMADQTVEPKLTRAKARETFTELNLNLTPIKHIPVKTRPEVEALIAQELSEDEDDEEYEPTPDDVPSDDDHVLETCTDIDSQPQTPATPKSELTSSPKIIKDGPFKVPQELTSSVKRKLELEEEATIALRTRSKLSLSSTSIEHIESTFVPPDDIPNPVVDEVWTQFLEGCLNPASTSKNEDDDDADPEYNVAADPDAIEEDEEALGNSIIKISKKELNDLINGLFNVMPDTTDSDDLAENLANTVLTDNTQNDISHWEGKQEVVSDNEERTNMSNRITFEKSPYTRLSNGKTEPKYLEEQPECPQILLSASRSEEVKRTNELDIAKEKEGDKDKERESNQVTAARKNVNKSVKITIVESEDTTSMSNGVDEAPLSLRVLATSKTKQKLEIQVEPGRVINPEQILILQQQLRQHIQLATSNFLQLYVHPQYWSYAPTYKKYLDTFMELVNCNSESVVNVCNLKPAMELMTTWQNTVSEDTPENAKLVQFIQKEVEKNRRNAAQNHLYIGDFPEMFKEVIVNSTVFLYPHLLPPIPYRADNPMKRNTYLQPEDSLIVLGLDQFNDYIEANPELFKKRLPHQRHRVMLSQTVNLVTKHMFPWMIARSLHSHITHIKKMAIKSNPIYKFLKNREIVPVRHKLLPFHPSLTVYEQPEVEMPPVWLKHVAKYSGRFKQYLRRNKRLIKEPEGVPVETYNTNTQRKDPLHVDFTKEIKRCKNSLDPIEHDSDLPPRIDIHIVTHDNINVTSTIYTSKNLETNTVSVINPLKVIETSQTNVVSCVSTPIITPVEINRNEKDTTECSQNIDRDMNSGHCTCCLVLRRICKRQTTILEYFNRDKQKKCFCSNIEYPKITNKLKMLIRNYKHSHCMDLMDLDKRLKGLNKEKEVYESVIPEVSDLEELAFVQSFQTRLISRTMTSKNVYIKMRVHRLFTNFKCHDDPSQLAAELGDICGTDLIDTYMDFMGFLNPEQADSLGMYKYYFTTVCVRKLVKRVEEEVKREDHLINILSIIRQVYSGNKSTACEICTRLLETMKDYPRLAEYVFKLFPHRKEKRRKKPDNNDNISDNNTQTPDEEYLQERLDEAEEIDEASGRLIMDCQEDYSSRSPVPVTQTVTDGDNLEKIKMEQKPKNESLISQTLDEADRSISDEECSNDVKSIVSTGIHEKHLTINPLVITSSNINENSKSSSDSEDIDQKPEVVQDYDNQFSMVIVCEEEDVKHEPSEWKREEDKLILEVLNQYLAPKERKDKTILEIISENNLFELISETLLHKSKEEVQERVLYLLNILINENVHAK